MLARGWVADHLPARRFDFAAHRYLARPGSIGAARVGSGPATFIDPTATEDGYWQFGWHDVAPGDLAWHEPLVCVQAADGDGGWVAALREGRAVDDQGYHLGVFHLGSDRHGRHRYAARWYTPYLGPEQPHRIVVLPNSGQPELASEAFA